VVVNLIMNAIRDRANRKRRRSSPSDNGRYPCYASNFGLRSDQTLLGRHSAVYGSNGSVFK
jgi:hypothetical protein